MDLTISVWIHLCQLFVHSNGHAVSGIKRARLNSKKPEMMQALGTTHAELALDHTDECTVDNIFSRMQKVCRHYDSHHDVNVSGVCFGRGGLLDCFDEG